MKAIPKLRFKLSDNVNYLDWRTIHLSDIVERITRRNANGESSRPLTISAQNGLVDQTEFFNKTVASKILLNYYLIHKGEFAYNKSYSNGYPWGAIKRLDNYESGVLSSLYILFSCKNNVCSDFLAQYFETNRWHKSVSEIAVEGARNHGLLNIPVNIFFATRHILPSLPEQQKIASFLSLIDAKIDRQRQKVDALEEYKKGLLQKIFSQEIRFKDDDGNDYPEWENKIFNDIFYTIPSRQYQVLTSAYLSSGQYEVIDQGKSNIVGFCNDSSKLFHDVPVIIYGDHTTIVKYRTKPFVIGADGTKILKTYDGDIIFYFYALAYSNVQPEGYKRHFSIVKNIRLYSPSIAEQKKIASFLSLFDIKIDKECESLQQIHKLKKGLLQQMFV